MTTHSGREAELRESTITDIVALIRSMNGGKHLFVGPLVWQPTDGLTARVWHVIVAMADEHERFTCARIICHDAAGRAALIAALMTRGLVIHDMDDELDMMRWCASLWPGKEILWIRDEIECERLERTAAA